MSSTLKNIVDNCIVIKYLIEANHDDEEMFWKSFEDYYPYTPDMKGEPGFRIFVATCMATKFSGVNDSSVYDILRSPVTKRRYGKDIAKKLLKAEMLTLSCMVKCKNKEKESIDGAKSRERDNKTVSTDEAYNSFDEMRISESKQVQHGNISRNIRFFKQKINKSRKINTRPVSVVS
ncbi:hypothetical protein TetV_535 [Tetraselmis virus 1]|uniref:Uncharacterized protein n=1 Tax=Tetraselmis virus 1 TaxID=2060617 RepID=A0A2P0VNZ0_9VIRU|nr:hypothetical protein QJ968_gp519 [Tetraselmis virus 1]AUF82617.1 hypothetical protein TetV_535 [Tetraselmis virus 1]